MNTAATKKIPVVAFALVTSLFLLWGIANDMNGTLLAAFRRIMSMSDFQTSLVQMAFYGSYFCFALPAAMFIKRFSYKSGIVLGLALYAAGTLLFRPAGDAASYPFFLIAIYIMAGGCAILETTANPYILAMGAPETATRRLNIAQSFNPLGAVIGIFLSRHFILGELNEADANARSSMSADVLKAIQHAELDAVSGTYAIIGCVLVVLLVVIMCVKMPSVRDTTRSQKSLTSVFKSLFSRRLYRYGVIAQFFYVGAQTCMWSFTIREVMAETGVREAAASDVFLCSIIAFTVFRFIFTALMKRYKPVRLMAIAAVGALASVCAIMLGSGLTVLVALVLTSAFMSLMFPTIYGIALEGIHGSETQFAASGLIMAIIGGALITPLQGRLSDLTGDISLSFIVPAICFVVVLTYAIYVINESKNR